MTFAIPQLDPLLPRHLAHHLPSHLLAYQRLFGCLCAQDYEKKVKQHCRDQLSLEFRSDLIELFFAHKYTVYWYLRATAFERWTMD